MQIFTFDLLQHLSLEVSRLLKLCVVQYFTLDEIYSHMGEPPGKQKRMGLVKRPLLKAWSGILAHARENCPVPG